MKSLVRIFCLLILVFSNGFSDYLVVPAHGDSAYHSAKSTLEEAQKSFNLRVDEVKKYTLDAFKDHILFFTPTADVLTSKGIDVSALNSKGRNIIQAFPGFVYKTDTKIIFSRSFFSKDLNFDSIPSNLLIDKFANITACSSISSNYFKIYEYDRVNYPISYLDYGYKLANNGYSFDARWKVIDTFNFNVCNVESIGNLPFEMKTSDITESYNKICSDPTTYHFDHNGKFCIRNDAENVPCLDKDKVYSEVQGKCVVQCPEGSFETATGCTTNCDSIENRETRFKCMCSERGLGDYVNSKISYKRSGICIVEGNNGCEGDIIPNSFYGTITCQNGVINKEKLVDEGKSVEEISDLFGTDDKEGGEGTDAGGGTGGGTGGGGGTEGGTEGGETPDQPDLPDKPDDPDFCTDELRDEVINRYADYVYNNVTHGVDCSDYTKTNWADKQRENIQDLINKYNSQCPGKAYNKIAINYKCKADPTQPENPENPEQPENPENPGQPVDPTNPTNPSVDPTNPSSEGDNNATITDPDNKEYCTAQNTLNMLQLATDVPRSAAPGITATINAFNERCGKKLVVKIKDDEGTGTGEEGKEEGEGECEGENCSFNGNDIAIGDSSKFDVDGSIGDSLGSFTSGYDEYLNMAEDAVGEAFEMYDKLGESYNNFNSTLENLTSGNPFVSRSVNSCVVDFELYNKVYHFDVCKYLSPYGDLVYMLLFIFLNLVLFIGALKLMVWIISSI